MFTILEIFAPKTDRNHRRADCDVALNFYVVEIGLLDTRSIEWNVEAAPEKVGSFCVSISLQNEEKRAESRANAQIDGRKPKRLRVDGEKEEKKRVRKGESERRQRAASFAATSSMKAVF